MISAARKRRSFPQEFKRFRAQLDALEQSVDQRKQAEEKSLTAVQRLAILREITFALSSTLDLHKVLDILLDRIHSIFPYFAAHVRLINKENGKLELGAYRSFNGEEWKEESMKSTLPLPRAVIDNKVPVVVSDVQADSRVQDDNYLLRHEVRSYVGIPMLVKGKVLGVLSVLTKEEHNFVNEDIEFLFALAEVTAIAVQHSQLFKEINEKTIELPPIVWTVFDLK